MNELLTPRDWQQIAQQKALELAGTPEAGEKLAEAKRYRMLADEVERLRAEQPSALKEKLRSAEDRIAELERTVSAQSAALEMAKVALDGAKCFIRNGVDLGFIRMPDADVPDPAHNTLPLVTEALAAIEALPAAPKGGA